MPGHRPERVADMLLRELAERLRSDIKDPRVGPISITHIEVTRDLSRAVVDYLPLGGGKPSSDLADGLADASRKVRGPIGRALRLRHAPEIVFRFDAKAEDTFRVMNVLDRLSAERRQREGGDEAVPEAEDNLADDAEPASGTEAEGEE
jgi:ribosome-binding factor A